MMEEDSDCLDVCLPLRSCTLSVLEYYILYNYIYYIICHTKQLLSAINNDLWLTG